MKKKKTKNKKQKDKKKKKTNKQTTQNTHIDIAHTRYGTINQE